MLDSMIYYLARWVFTMQKWILNKRYIPEFKKLVIGNYARRKTELQRDGTAVWSQCPQTDHEIGTHLSDRGAGRVCSRALRSWHHRPSKEGAEKGWRRSAGRIAASACGEWLPKKLANLAFGRRATPAQKT